MLTTKQTDVYKLLARVQSDSAGMINVCLRDGCSGNRRCLALLLLGRINTHVCEEGIFVVDKLKHLSWFSSVWICLGRLSALNMFIEVDS